MVYSQAIEILRPFITRELAEQYMAVESDWGLWIECNVFILAPETSGLSHCTPFGECVSDWACEELAALVNVGYVGHMRS